jgi:hypothetical protein
VRILLAGGKNLAAQITGGETAKPAAANPKTTKPKPRRKAPPDDDVQGELL